MYPSYLKLYSDGELTRRAEELTQRMERCDLCPFACGVNRLKGFRGLCGCGRNILIHSHQVDFGEEPPVSGTNGSGRIFFAYPEALRSKVHPVHDSYAREPMEISVKKMANIMLYLQEEQCHNINLVMPVFHLPMVVEALGLAAADGLRLPLVYVGDAYESAAALKLLDGIVDIYIPRVLFADDNTASMLSAMERYTEHSRAALAEMYAQVGNLVVQQDVAHKGMIVRHMILPGGLGGTEQLLPWIASEISQECFISLLGSYQPSLELRQPRVLNRDVSPEEFEAAVMAMKSSGLNNGWLQQPYGGTAPQSNFLEDSL